MTCKECRFFDRKKVAQPKSFGMCQNKDSAYHKGVVKNDFECKKFKAGDFRKEYVVYLLK